MDISTYIRQHESTITPLFKDYCLRFWELSVSGVEANEKALATSKERYLRVYADRDEFGQVRQWMASVDGLDPIDVRRLKLIHDAFVPYQMDGEVLREIVQRETHIENLFNTFRADFEGSRVSENQIRDVLQTETQIQRRRAAWETSKQVGHEVAPLLLELVAIRNREARRLGYPDYYSMMFEVQELDQRRVFSLLERLERLSEQAFSGIKASLDSSLKQKFGVTDPEDYPWLYSDPFFQEFPKAGVSERFDAVFQDRNIEALTQAHYDSLGLDIRDLLGRADLYERDGKSQHAFCLDVDHEGDVRVLCNIRQNERWMGTMLHEFGHAVYDKFHDPALPFLLRTPAHILTTEAVAMLNGRMTKDPQWLKSIAGVPAREATDLSESASQALRSEMLIFLRWAITLVRFERELYRDPAQNLNRLWWEYVERYQKVTPPPNRDRPDWAAKIHLSTSPAYYQNYILGELMASQLLEFIHRQVVKSDRYAGHPEAGKFLIDKVFKPGARYEWNHMLREATGEDLNPQYWIRQFVE